MGARCLILAACTGTARAQDAQTDQGAIGPMDAEAAPGEIGDIIVTARRRTEGLQETPVAITAIQPA